MKGKILLLMLLASSVSHADGWTQWPSKDNTWWPSYGISSGHHNHDNCVREYINKVDEYRTLEPQCLATTPLFLAWTTLYYPNLRDNPRRVQYWEGKYARGLIMTEVFERELVDTCRGRVISKSAFKNSYRSEIEFKLANPNLDTNITESYMLSPMTEAEAKQEMQNTLQLCQAYYIQQN